MAMIHQYSTPTIRSDVDLFSLPPTCTTVEESFYAEYKPVVNVQDSNAKLEFRIPGSHHYIDLNDHFLYIQAQVVDKDGSALEASDELSCCNNLLHSMFSQVELFLNNQKVTNGSSCYPFKSSVFAKQQKSKKSYLL